MPIPQSMSRASIPPFVRWLFGPPLLVFGAIALAAALGWIPLEPSRTEAPPWIIGAIGVSFCSFGLFLLLDGVEALSSLRGWLGLGFLVSFASIFNWVAFGPGERHFRSSTTVGFEVGAVASSSSGSELGGRVAFGIFAVLLDLLIASPLLVAIWRRLRAGQR